MMEDISFDASERQGQFVEINSDYVKENLDELVANEDLSRFIL